MVWCFTSLSKLSDSYQGNQKYNHQLSASICDKIDAQLSASIYEKKNDHQLSASICDKNMTINFHLVYVAKIEH